MTALGKIIQIASTTCLNKEIDKEMVLVYALTDKGRLFEYLAGCWVELNPLRPENLGEFRDGKLVLRTEHGNGQTVARN